MKSNSQRMADLYSEVGTHPVFVGVYEDEAVLWAQCSEGTANRLGTALANAGPLDQVEAPALSEDGLTCCWLFRRSRRHGRKVDWLPVVMTEVYAAVREHAPVLLDEQDAIMYKDNREMDANTVERFLRQITPRS